MLAQRTQSYDVIVVGVGAMGAATCRELARRGVRVLGLEQLDLAHGLGSSGGQTRLIRLAYYEHPDYVPLLRRAYQGWDALDRELEEPLLHRTGCLYLGPPTGHLVAGTRRAAREHGLELESIDGGALRDRFPQFRLPDSFAALHEPSAGFVLAERALAALAEQALRAGAVLRARERVRSWQVDGDGFVVRTDRGEHRAERLVFTAGAWSGSLLAGLQVPLRVTRQVVGWVWPPDPAPFELGRLPCWAIEDDAAGFAGIYYGFPLLPAGRYGGERGLKVGHHAPGPGVDPDALDRDASAADEDDFRPALVRYLPDAQGETTALRVCMYTMTPDGHFVLDRHPEHPAVTIACGFSGHGFKFAPVIGEALADLALDGRSELPIGFLGLRRFARQRPR